MQIKLSLIILAVYLLFGFAAAYNGYLALLNPDNQPFYILFAIAFLAAAGIAHLFLRKIEKGESDQDKKEIIHSVQENKKRILDQIYSLKEQLTPKATLEGFQKELEESAEEKKDELKKKASQYFRSGEEAYDNHLYKQAAIYYHQSIDILPTMAAYLNLGSALLNISEYEAAIEANKSGLEMAEFKKDYNYMGSFLGNLAAVCGEQNMIQEALYYCNRALEINQSNGNMSAYANDLGNKGSIYLALGKLDEAEETYKQAIEIKHKLRDHLGEAKVRSNLAIVYFHQGRLNLALSNYVRIPDQTGHPFRSKVATHSDSNRPPIPEQNGHLFRQNRPPVPAKPATLKSS